MAKSIYSNYRPNGYTSARPAIFGIAKVVGVGLSKASYASAAPILMDIKKKVDEETPDSDDPRLWYV